MRWALLVCLFGSIQPCSSGPEPNAAGRDSKRGAHVTFEYQAVLNDAGGPSVITNYIPENAVLDVNQRLEIRRDLIIKTNPPLRDTWLGDLVSSRKSARIVPRHVLTDGAGQFRATIIGKSDRGTWGELRISSPPRNSKTPPIATLQRENESAIARLREQDAPTQLHLTADPVDLYARDPDGDNIVVKLPAFRVPLPAMPGAHFVGMRDIEDGKLHLIYRNPKISGRTLLVAGGLPEEVKAALAFAASDQLFSYMWYSERNAHILGDGQLYIRAPKAIGPAYTPPAGVELRAISQFSRGGILAALVDNLDRHGPMLQGIDLSTGSRVWAFPLRDLNDAQHLLWVSDRFILATSFGRQSSNYAVIDILRKKVVKRGLSMNADEFIIEDRRLIQLDRWEAKKRAVFSFVQN